MMNILAFDTSTEAFSVALKIGDVTFQHYEIAPRMHAQKILPTIDDLLKQSGCVLRDIDAFVFGRGPGAFTGVRTAVGVVQGLAYALDKPVLGISTLMAMAEGARRERGATQVISAIDARMGEVYWGAYFWQNGAWQISATECVVAPTKVQWPGFPSAFAVGSGWAPHRAALNPPAGLSLQIEDAIRYPNAIDMLNLAIPALQRGESVAAHLAEPVYLRDHVADKPAAKI